MKSKGGKWRFWPSRYLIFLTNKKTGGRRLHFTSGEFREGLVVLGHAKHMTKRDKRKKLSISSEKGENENFLSRPSHPDLSGSDINGL